MSENTTTPVEDELVDETAEITPDEVSETPAPTVVQETVEINVDYKDDLQRLNAEYVNYRKRVERDKDLTKATTISSVLESLLPVLDDLEAAEKHGDLVEGHPFYSIAKKFEHVLNNHGLSAIREDNVEFDPNIHQAVIATPSTEHPDSTVMAVFRTGYLSKGQVLRAAQVQVSQGE